MLIPEPLPAPRVATTRILEFRRTGKAALFIWLIALGALVVSCKKDQSFDAMNSDANGYLCLKCGVKLYTARTVFIGPKCPKCGEESLMSVAGYYCEKDKHLTIRAQHGDPRSPACEICQAPLVNAMRMPREAELTAWGATKASP